MEIKKYLTSTLLITGVTIGAGMLSLPYVFAPLGTAFTIFCLLGLGLVMLSLNLMIAEVAFALKKPLQLPGLAQAVLGRSVERFLTGIIIISWLGSLLAYIVGEGDVLSSLFGGSPFWWSIGFWLIASLVIMLGFKAAARSTRVVSGAVIALLVGISLYALSKAHSLPESFPLSTFHVARAFGVALFALHGAPAIAAAHLTLSSDKKNFYRAVTFGSLIPVAVYILFTLGVVAVTGSATTQVATIGLGKYLGTGITVLGALAALGAMFSCYSGIGTALRETLVWDNHSSPLVATLIPLGVPLALFLFGVRDFSRVMGLVGGVLIAAEAVIMVVVYIGAVNKGIIPRDHRIARHPYLVGVPVIALCVIGAISSLLGG